MKRALAERAKQSGLPNGVGSSMPGSEPTTGTSSPLPSSQSVPEYTALKDAETTSSHHLPSNDEMPSKSLSIATKGNGPSSSSTPVPSPRTAPSPRPKKRLRESVVKLEEQDEDDSNASAFFLRHQNRALASELRQLKYQIHRLERERDTRRTQCTLAVQNLNTLQVTWSQLEDALQFGRSSTTTDSDLMELSDAHSGLASSSSRAPPLSTGSGTSVELVGALFHSLAQLGNVTTTTRRRNTKNGDDLQSVSEEDHDEDENVHMEEPIPEDQAQDDFSESAYTNQQLDDLLQITNKISTRARTLQGWIWTLLQRLENGTTERVGVAEQVHAAQQQVARLKAKNMTMKAKMKELARSRDESQESDKRVRRGLYRLAAGRVQLNEVLKAIVAADEDKETVSDWLAPSSQDVLVPPGGSSSALLDNSSSLPLEKEDEANLDGKESAPITSAELLQLQKKVVELEQVAKTRDERIKTLLAEREEQMNKISGLVLAGNSTSLPTLTEDDVKKSDLYTELSSKLMTAQRKLKEHEEYHQRIKGEWGQAVATAEAAQKAIEELQSKQVKRWTDLVDEFPDLAEKEDAGCETNPDKQASTTKGKEIVILQHKLTQALENVRQAEGTRKTLNEAVILNEALQSKLEEIKAKYTALQQSRSNGSGNNNNNPATSTANADPATAVKAKVPTTTPSSSEKLEKAERSEKSEKSAEKLHREYRRIQKQLAAVTASKEAAKSKLERVEKDRDSLNAINARLLKQAAEKDDMNAKSLSTILHLKQLTDQITKEKENLEQQVKSSQQLALSARLAANARERLTEELDKERQLMESHIKEWEAKYGSLSEEKEQVEAKLAQSRSKLAGLLKEMDGARARCEELASESTKLQQEKQSLLESLAVAQKEVEAAHKLTERMAKASGGAIVEGFTAEQLHTQVKHLQSRVNCPVCNVRDKKCILLRCRHMFCKNCVDENIKNRSRKCPMTVYLFGFL